MICAMWSASSKPYQNGVFDSASPDADDDADDAADDPDDDARDGGATSDSEGGELLPLRGCGCSSGTVAAAASAAAAQ